MSGNEEPTLSSFMRKRGGLAHKELLEQEPKDWRRGAPSQEESLRVPSLSLRGVLLLGMTSPAAYSGLPKKTNFRSPSLAAMGVAGVQGADHSPIDRSPATTFALICILSRGPLTTPAELACSS